MKYLMINVVCGIGSTGRICTDLAVELERQGNEVKIAYGRGEVPEKYKKYAVRIGTNKDVKMHALKARLFDECGFGSRKVTEDFILWVKRFDPDVIHLHNLHGYYINIEVLFEYLKNCGKQIIWTLHDCWAFTGHCSYFSYVKCDKWKDECECCPQKHQYPKSIFCDKSKSNWNKKRVLFRNIDNMSLITPSQWLANLVKESFLGDYPIKVKNNTINKSIFKYTPSKFREKNNLINDKIILGVANVWDERKGLDDFFELSTLVDNSYKIVLVGMTNKQKNFIEKNHKNIICITNTKNVQELAEIYSAADVFVNPSREETFGMTTIEALSCGTVPIVYKDTACEEIVNKYGGIVSDPSPREIYKIICDLNKKNLFRKG